jgi:hypothetical protein
MALIQPICRSKRSIPIYKDVPLTMTASETLGLLRLPQPHCGPVPSNPC